MSSINKVLYGDTNYLNTLKDKVNKVVNKNLKQISKEKDGDYVFTSTKLVEAPMPPVKAYIGCSWFSDKQTKHMKAGIEAIKANPSVSWEYSHYPLAHQYKGMDVNKNPEIMLDKEWQMVTVSADIEGIKGCELGIMLYVPSEPDDGQAWEMGNLYGHGKQCVVVIPDDEVHEPLNLMVACGTTRIIKLSELATFDFRHVVADVYEGEVY